ncbi:peptide chain release factor H [Chitinophagaceae bacterium MMS25-I14]
MNKQLIQISSGRGPQECQRAAARVLELLLTDARNRNLETEVLERIPGDLQGTFHSATISVKGKDITQLLNEWEGTVQWIAQSPYRKMHKRKNWFVSIQSYPVPEQVQWNEKDVEYTTCRSSGPGGQHVNKTETAVRATHKPSGVSVVASDRRSQLQNKKEATERLRQKITAWQMTQMLAGIQQQWAQHTSLKRGEAIKTIEAKL